MINQGLGKSSQTKAIYFECKGYCQYTSSISLAFSDKKRLYNNDAGEVSISRQESEKAESKSKEDSFKLLEKKCDVMAREHMQSAASVYEFVSFQVTGKPGKSFKGPGLSAETACQEKAQAARAEK